MKDKNKRNSNKFLKHCNKTNSDDPDPVLLEFFFKYKAPFHLIVDTTPQENHSLFQQNEAFCSAVI